MTHTRSSIPASDIREEALRTEFAMLVTFHAKPEYRKVLEKLLREDVVQARKEEGNLSMHLYRARENPDTYFLFERWKHQEALDAHFEKPYTKAVLELGEKALTVPMDILFLNDLAPISPVHYRRAPRDSQEATDLFVIFDVKEGEQERFIRQFGYSAQNSRPEPGWLRGFPYPCRERCPENICALRTMGKQDRPGHSFRTTLYYGTVCAV